jgi:hypothetical protein
MYFKNKERALIKFLLLERFAREEIAISLRNVYASAAYGRASVGRWISEVHRGKEELRSKGRPERLYRNEKDAAILSILQEDPNAWPRIITETGSISAETVRTHISRIGCTPKTLCWISYARTCELKQIRLTMCLQLLPKLRAHAQDNWRHPITGMKAGFTTSMVEIEYEQHGMKTRLKSKTGPFLPEACTEHFMESPRILYCHNVSSERCIQCIMVHRSERNPLA